MNQRLDGWRITDTHVYFWGSIYSQFYLVPVYHDGIMFKSAEHFMMYHKAMTFGDTAIAKQILTVDEPKDAKKLGKKVARFSEEIWGRRKKRVVTLGSILKYTQNPHLLEILTRDKDKILVEASPYDRIWGIGLHYTDDLVLDQANWRGENLLGECLMEARRRILG